MSYEKTYKNNYLTNVIARIDFVNPVPGIQDEIPNSIIKEIIRIFPITEPKRKFLEQVTVLKEDVKREKTEFTEWHFFGKEREKVLTIIPNSVFVDYSVYKSYSTFKNEFLQVINKYFEYYPDVIVNRLGLRYINNLVIDNGDPLDWNDYLNSKMLSLFSFYQKSKLLSRVFHNIEYNFGDFNLRYQFGMHNPDYPATIRKKSYILDLDAYYHSEQSITEISNNLDKFHEIIQELFELSITNNLRSILDEQ